MSNSWGDDIVFMDSNSDNKLSSARSVRLEMLGSPVPSSVRTYCSCSSNVISKHNGWNLNSNDSKLCSKAVARAYVTAQCMMHVKL